MLLYDKSYYIDKLNLLNSEMDLLDTLKELKDFLLHYNDFVELKGSVKDEILLLLHEKLCGLKIEINMYGDACEIVGENVSLLLNLKEFTIFDNMNYSMLYNNYEKEKIDLLLRRDVLITENNFNKSKSKKNNPKIELINEQLGNLIVPVSENNILKIDIIKRLDIEGLYKELIYDVDLELKTIDKYMEDILIFMWGRKDYILSKLNVKISDKDDNDFNIDNLIYFIKEIFPVIYDVDIIDVGLKFDSPHEKQVIRSSLFSNINDKDYLKILFSELKNIVSGVELETLTLKVEDKYYTITKNEAYIISEYEINISSKIKKYLSEVCSN